MNPGQRISKDPEVRREELIDAAEVLFEEKGYDDTSVSDIVRKVGVAQGTFYLYFRSKDEVLEAFVDRLVNEVTTKLTDIADHPGKSALDKMFQLSITFRSIGVGRERMTDLIHEDQYAPLHHKLERKVLPPTVGILTRIIEQGIREGVFDVPFPREAAIAVLGISQQFGEGKHDNSLRKKLDIDELRKVLGIIERVLGTKEGMLMKHYEEMMR